MRLMTPEEVDDATRTDPARGRYPRKSWKARRVPHQDITPRARPDPGRIRIPLGTLRDWEQGRTEPDQPARAYLTVIAHDPDGVRRREGPERAQAQLTLEATPVRELSASPRVDSLLEICFLFAASTICMILAACARLAAS